LELPYFETRHELGHRWSPQDWWTVIEVACCHAWPRLSHTRVRAQWRLAATQERRPNCGTVLASSNLAWRHRTRSRDSGNRNLLLPSWTLISCIVAVRNGVCWDATPCDSYKNISLGGTCASIIRMERISDIGTLLAINSNWEEFDFIRNVLQLLVTDKIVPRSLIFQPWWLRR
jgi:hypothetical protein